MIPEAAVGLIMLEGQWWLFLGSGGVLMSFACNLQDRTQIQSHFDSFCCIVGTSFSVFFTGGTQPNSWRSLDTSKGVPAGAIATPGKLGFCLANVRK